MNQIVKDILKVVLVAIGFYLLFSTYDCTRSKKGDNDTTIVHSETRDTVYIIDTIIKNTKPKVITKWLTPRTTHDITEQQPNYVYSNCDSTVIQLDTGTTQGVKYAIVDTLQGNEILGRELSFYVPERTITHTIRDSIFINRTDTVFIKKKGLLRAYLFGLASGIALRSALPR
jgi:hypothetical protein